MSHRLLVPTVSAILIVVAVAAPARAQRASQIGIRGVGLGGTMVFTASNSFDAVLDRHNGPVYGGGVDVLLPWNVYVGVDAWQFKQDGQRVFVADDQVFKLGIPVQVTMTPIELTGGYRFTGLWRKVVPYAGVGYSSYRYKETSQFADASEDVDERFSGYHFLAGVEYRASTWISVGGEVVHSSIADAIGQDGVSRVYNEDNLGGTTARFKISVGR